MIPIKTVVNVSDQRISDMLCNALDSGGGSLYWIDRAAYYLNGKEMSAAALRKALKGVTLFDESMTTKALQDPPYIWIPIVEGGALQIKVNEPPYGRDDSRGDTFLLTYANITTGLQVMAEKYSKHFQDMINENDDAATGDVFLQCCLFNETIYG